MVYSPRHQHVPNKCQPILVMKGKTMRAQSLADGISPLLGGIVRYTYALDNLPRSLIFPSIVRCRGRCGCGCCSPFHSILTITMMISCNAISLTTAITTAIAVISICTAKESGKDGVEPKTIAARRIGKVQEGDLRCLGMVESGPLLPTIITARACATALQIVVARTLVVPSQQTFPPPSPPPVGETGGGGLVRIVRESDGVIAAAARRCDQCQHPSRSATTPLRLACAAAAAAAC